MREWGDGVEGVHACRGGDKWLIAFHSISVLVAYAPMGCLKMVSPMTSSVSCPRLLFRPLAPPTAPPRRR